MKYTSNVPVVIALLSMSFFDCCTAGKKAGFSIQGELAGLNDDSVVIYAGHNGPAGEARRDTIIVRAVNGRFSVRGRIAEPGTASVVIGGFRGRRNFSFFLEAGKIVMKGSVDSTEYVRITGTPDNDDLTAASARENGIYEQVRARYARLKDKMLSREATQQLNAEIDELRDSVKRVRIGYVTAHPNSLASGIYLYVLQDRIPVGELDTLYSGLGLRVKRSAHGLIVARNLEAKKKTLIGMEAPLFEAEDLAGRKVRLADLRGKYVLLDFWASWCVPCRAETPYLAAAYRQFRDRDFVILSVSMDDSRQKWVEAVAKDGMVWTNVSDLKAFDNKVAKLYGVQPIPDNFLIDADGKIIARGLRGEDLVKKLTETIK